MSKPNQLTPAEVVELLAPVLEDLDEVLNRTFGNRLGYKIVSIQDGKSLTLYQSLGNAQRYVRIVHDLLRKEEEEPEDVSAACD